MPWKQKSTKMELRLEFVTLAMRENANISSLCRRFGVSRTTGYKWIRRYKADGKEGLKDRSRRPHSSPNKTSDRIEEAVCAVRRQHPGWGGRKIHKVLQRKAEANKAPFDEEKVRRGEGTSSLDLYAHPASPGSDFVRKMRRSLPVTSALRRSVLTNFGRWTSKATFFSMTRRVAIR